MTPDSDAKLRENKICFSPLTGQSYLVTMWNKDGSALHKIDITEELERIVLAERERVRLETLCYAADWLLNQSTLDCRHATVMADGIRALAAETKEK